MLGFASSAQPTCLASFEQVGLSKNTMVGKTYTINAGDRVEIRTGLASLIMESDGSISLHGKQVLIEGSEGTLVRGQEVNLEQSTPRVPAQLAAIANTEPQGKLEWHFMQKIPYEMARRQGIPPTIARWTPM